MEKKKRKYLETFPQIDVEPINESNKEFVSGFRSAENNEENYIEFSIGEYLVNEAYANQKAGKGVTYIVIDKKNKKTIAFFTLSSSSLMIMLEHDDDRENADQLIDNYSPVQSVKVDYFAVDVDYQDTFYEDKPLAAHIFNMMISMLFDMSTNRIGYRAVYLYSLDSSADFYLKNGLARISDAYVVSEGLPVDDVNALLYRAIHPLNTNGFKKTGK